MIYHKIWLVVKPTVGIPVFLGAVAVGSFAVHLAVGAHLDWIKPFINGTPVATKKAEAQTTTAAVAVPEQKPEQKPK
jgi:light-harvesting protein B-800-850 alpha chain